MRSDYNFLVVANYIREVITSAYKSKFWPDIVLILRGLGKIAAQILVMDVVIVTFGAVLHLLYILEN